MKYIMILILFLMTSGTFSSVQAMNKDELDAESAQQGSLEENALWQREKTFYYRIQLDKESAIEGELKGNEGVSHRFIQMPEIYVVNLSRKEASFIELSISGWEVVTYTNKESMFQLPRELFTARSRVTDYQLADKILFNEPLLFKNKNGVAQTIKLEVVTDPEFFE